VEDLFQTKPEEPHSKTRRYAVSGVAFVILMSFGLWFFFLRYLSEKRAVASFLDAVVAEKFDVAYKIWKPDKSYTFDRFMGDWGTTGFYGPVKSYRIGNVRAASGASGTVVVVATSPETTFPADNDAKSGKTRYVALWVEGKDMSLSFAP
jgi:hypothetical protein